MLTEPSYNEDSNRTILPSYKIVKDLLWPSRMPFQVWWGHRREKEKRSSSRSHLQAQIGVVNC